jgi:hypothetical protein
VKGLPRDKFPGGNLGELEIRLVVGSSQLKDSLPQTWYKELREGT